jgi:hypothetical protein
MEDKWIWMDTADFPTNLFLEARKIVDIEDSFGQASITISANQEYRLYINGYLIGRGPSPCDYRWQYYDTYEIGEYLRIGSNCIACLCYHIGESESTISYDRGPGGLFVRMKVETKERTIVLSTDDTWKIRRSPRWVQRVTQISRWGGFKEIYLAEQEDGWLHAEYDDAEWPSPLTVSTNDPLCPFTHLLPREIPHLHRESLKPVAVARVDANLGAVFGVESLVTGTGNVRVLIHASVPGSMPGMMVDFGKEVVGYPKFRLRATSGGVMELRYGESLDVEHVDTIILKAGVTEWSSFGRRAFRYMQVNFHACPDPIELTQCEVEMVHYPFAEGGTFACSDPLLNRIWEIGKHTVLMNSQEHLEDCPWREKALWIVDEYIMAKVIYHLYRDTRLIRKSLLQGARIQKVDGAIPATGPESNNSVFTDFCIYWVLAVCDYWKNSLDREFIGIMRPHVESVISWLERMEDEQGLLLLPDDYCFIDWASHIDRREKVTAASCLYVRALKELAEIACSLGWVDLSARWGTKAEMTRAAIRRCCRDPERGIYADCVTSEGRSDKLSLQTNFMAVWCGIMTDEEVIQFFEYYDQQTEQIAIKSPFFQHFVLESLYRYGKTNKALGVIRNYWGAMLQRGATTFWETFDLTTPECVIPHRFQGNTPTYLRDDVPVSHCHGWGASPVYVLMQSLLGIDRMNGIQGNVVRFRPGLVDLDWARGSVVVPQGLIEISWTRIGNISWECAISAPYEIELEIDLSDAAFLSIGTKQVYLNGIAMVTVDDARDGMNP